MICYLDNAATTRPYDEVIQYMDTLQKECYGNPSSMHRFGVHAEKELEHARGIISSVMRILPQELIFTSSATEASNTCIRGFLNRNPHAGNHLICSAIEHPSILGLFQNLSRSGFSVDYVDVDETGIVDLDHFQSLLKPTTALVSVMYVNNETGAVQPIEKLKKIIHNTDSAALLHVDSVQGFCKFEFHPKKLGVDMATVSAHKFHGPKGAAAFYVRKGIHLAPIQFGGGQEKGLRSGTENVPAIGGFAKAVELALPAMNSDFARVAQLRKKFLSLLQIKDLKIHGGLMGSPYILNFSIPGIPAEVMLHHLESVGVYVSTGSACASNKNIESHVLKAMGIPKAQIQSSLRISFGKMNTLQEIEYAAEQFNKFTALLRGKK